MKCSLTVPNPEGPFYRPGAPFRKKLNSNVKGQPLLISGIVKESPDCNPVAGAILDVWQADAEGRYDIEYIKDLRQYILRGRIHPDREGRYGFETIFPGAYELAPGVFRARHVHCKVYAPGYAPLTTQLYFKGDPLQKSDPLVRESLILDLKDNDGILEGKMDFVLNKPHKELYRLTDGV